MLKKLSTNIWFQPLIIFLVAILTFLPTVQMFFYLDEYGNLYDFSHGDFRGTNIFTAKVFSVFFHFFGTNPEGYFAVGTLIFALSALLFYFFVSKLTSNKLLALLAALIYATSPVGTSTVVMIWTYVMEGGYPLTIALLLLLFLLLRYFKDRRIYYYFLALFAFMVFMELEPRRVFLFLPIIILFDYLMHFQKIIIPDYRFFLRQIPFFALFTLYYKYNVTLSGIFSNKRIYLNDTGNYDWQTKLDLLLNTFSDPKPLVTLANILLGPILIFPKEILNLTAIKETYFWTFMIVVMVVFLVVIGWKVKREFGLILVFALGWMYINIIGIYVFSSPGISEVTHRTLSLAAPGYALFISLSGYCLYKYLKAKKVKRFNVDKVFVIFCIVFLVYSMIATRNHFENFNKFRSYASHGFFKSLKTYYPTLPPNSIIYIETSGNPHIKNQLTRIYGGNNYGAGATIAIFYPELKKDELDVLRDYKKVLEFVDGDLLKIDHVFAFYFDEKGLADKTDEVREKLRTNL